MAVFLSPLQLLPSSSNPFTTFHPFRCIALTPILFNSTHNRNIIRRSIRISTSSIVAAKATSTSPSFISSRKIPVRTSSAPPNLDEQKREQLEKIVRLLLELEPEMDDIWHYLNIQGILARVMIRIRHLTIMN